MSKREGKPLAKLILVCAGPVELCRVEQGIRRGVAMTEALQAAAPQQKHH